MAVQLHDDFLFEPHCVYEPTGDPDVYFGWGKRAALAEEQKDLLEPALRSCELRAVAFEGHAERGTPGLAAAEHRRYFIECHQLQELGLGECAPQLGETHHARDVEERLSRWGNGQAPVQHALEPLLTMNPHLR